MKDSNTQLESRPVSLQTESSMRIDSFSKIAVKEACKANAVDEACSPPRMQVFELPLSQEASAIAILPRPSRPQQRADTGIKAHAAEHGRSRGRWSVSPLWEGKILLGVLREKGLAGKGLVSAFEKWAPTVAGCSRADMNRVYCVSRPDARCLIMFSCNRPTKLFVITSFLPKPRLFGGRY